MKKKLGIALLAAVMSIGSALPAHAAEVDEKVEESISPRYENIAQIIRGFELNADWVAEFGVVVYPKDYSDIEVEVNVQEYDDDVEDWVTVESCYGSEKNTLILTLADEAQVSPHCVARAEFIVTVTTDGVEEVETRYSYDN